MFPLRSSLTWIYLQTFRLGLDAEVGWQKLLGTRDEIAEFGELATNDPLSLAAEKYVYMRKFAPAIRASFSQCFQAISVCLRPIVRPKRITQWVSHFQTFQMLIPAQHQ